MMVNFNSFTKSKVKMVKNLHLECPSPHSSKGLRFFNKLKKRGFTLAETLITLTIIGIIAAMTIPTLVSKYQEHVTVNKLKKAYSVLSNAFKMYVSENGPFEDYSSLTNTYCSWIKNTNVNCAELIKPYIKGELINNDSIMSEDGIIYGFHELYMISAIVGKYDKNKNQFEQKPGTTFWFSVSDNGLVLPGVYNREMDGVEMNETLSVNENLVCPKNQFQNRNENCTYWTLRTGKIHKKAGETL